MKQNIIISTNIKILINTTFVKASLTYLIKLIYLFIFNLNAQTFIIFYTKTVKTFEFPNIANSL